MRLSRSSRLARPGSIALSLLLCALFVLGAAGPAAAAPGDRDVSFGSGGSVITPAGAGDDFGRALAIQSDGKVLVAGATDGASDVDFGLVRYHPDGSLDTTFDGDGKVTTSIGAADDIAEAVAVQPDGRIVVAGYYDNGADLDVAVVRYNADGTPDTTWDGDGIATTAVWTLDDIVEGVAVQPDGRIVVAGYSSDGFTANFSLVRFEEDGSLDTSFDGDGKVLTAFDGGEVNASSMALAPDGRIVVAGHYSVPDDLDFAVARYEPDGSLDTSFGGSGKVTTSVQAGLDFGEAVAVQPDGKVVVAGWVQPGDGPDDSAVVRYNQNGTLDTTFDGDGKLVTALAAGEDDFGRDVLIQPDGKIVVAGYARLDGDTDALSLTRYTTTGVLDDTFDDDGIMLDPITGSLDRGRAVALDPDGKIVVAGDTFGTTWDVLVARYDWTACTISGDANNNLLKGTKNADVICGLGGNDTLTGLEGNDVLIGGDGNDTLLGGRGDDALLGGTGTDSAQFQDSGVSGPLMVDLVAGVATNAVLGTDTILRVGGYSTVENVEGSPGPDTITGDAGRNVINAKSGDDEIYGGGGPDLLQGNLGVDQVSGDGGNDVIMPGAGPDTADGGDGVDVLRYSDLSTGVGVFLNNTSQTSTDDPSIAGFESLIGSSGGDQLTAGVVGVSSLVVGGPGQDQLGTLDGDHFDTIFDNQGTAQDCSAADSADTVSCT